MSCKTRSRILGASALICVVLALSGSGFAQQASPATGQQKIVVHLKHFTDDLHAAFMAVKLAGALKDEGADVTMFVDLEGVGLADSRQPQDLRWGHSRALSDYYAAWVKKGGRVLVCPHCAKAAGLQAGSLREGAKIGTEQEVAALLISADKILDY
jgi:predicted peroxiredoxin